MLIEYLRNPRILIGLLLILAGFDIGMLWTYLPRLIGILLILIGALITIAGVRGQKREAGHPKMRQLRTTPTSTAPRLSNRLIHKLTLNGMLIPYLWVIGILLIAVDLVINFVIQKSIIAGNDLIMIFFGASLIIYRPPSWMVFGKYLAKYTRELDFVVIFLGLLVVILVVPMYLAALATGTTQGATTGDPFLDNLIVYPLLTAPLSGILSVLGINNSATGAYLMFSQANGHEATIAIAATCAGIYSFGIFLSAFIAFVLSEYTKFTKQIGILLVIGSLLTYLANLLRMTLIVLSGYYNGIGDTADPAPFTLLWTHRYVGEIIFIAWVAVFWWVAFRYFAEDETVEPEVSPKEETKAAPAPEPSPIRKSEWTKKTIELRKGKIA